MGLWHFQWKMPCSSKEAFVGGTVTLVINVVEPFEFLRHRVELG